jgi:hypothetical protein
LDGVNGKTTVANPYAYVMNDPLNHVDPSGMRCTDSSCFDDTPPAPPDPLACAGVTNAPAFNGPDHLAGESQLYQFSIPVKYCKGVVRINGFISQEQVTGPDGTTFYGDHRDFDSRSWAQQSRASIELDFQRGLGRLFVNHTCRDAEGGLILCTAADPIAVPNPGESIDITTSRNWSGFNEFSHELHGDSMELRFNWPNPAVKQFGVGPCAITGKMTVDFGGDGDGVKLNNIVTRDFPSFEVYHYSGSRTNTLLQSKEHDLPDICAGR